MAFLKIKKWEFEDPCFLPISKADDMGQLLRSEQDTEDAFENSVLLSESLIELVDFLSLFFVFVLELEDFLRSVFVLSSQISQ